MLQTVLSEPSKHQCHFLDKEVLMILPLELKLHEHILTHNTMYMSQWIHGPWIRYAWALLYQVWCVQLWSFNPRDRHGKKKWRLIQHRWICWSPYFGVWIAYPKLSIPVTLYRFRVTVLKQFLCVTQVWEHWTMGTLVEIMDSSLSSLAPRDQMLKCINIGLLCVQDDPAERPKMSTVNVMLSSSTVTLQAPSRPAFCIPTKSGFNSEIYSEGYPGAIYSASRSPMSLNDVSITELEPRWSTLQRWRWTWCAVVATKTKFGTAKVSGADRISDWEPNRLYNINICFSRMRELAALSVVATDTMFLFFWAATDTMFGAGKVRGGARILYWGANRHTEKNYDWNVLRSSSEIKKGRG